MGKDLKTFINEKVQNNKGCAIFYFGFIGLIFILFFYQILEDFKDTSLKPCEQYNLSRYAKTCEDLLITHEATGIITKRFETFDNKYITKINSKKWKQTTPEQRLLIICSAKEVAKKKHLKSMVLDEKGIDY